MKKIIIILIIISINFIGCTATDEVIQNDSNVSFSKLIVEDSTLSDKIEYKDLDTCHTELLVDTSSGMIHKIYKIDIPAKTSIKIRGVLAIISDDNLNGCLDFFNEKEIGLFGGNLTNQIISITGNNNIEKKVVIVENETSCKTTEDKKVNLKKLIEDYCIKEEKILKTGIIKDEDIFQQTNKDIKINNYPYIGSTRLVSFWLTNNTEETQSVYYSIFFKDTLIDVGINAVLYLWDAFFATENSKQENNINYGELYKLISISLEDSNIESKIKKMGRYQAQQYIKKTVKNILENCFGELSNLTDKTVNYLCTIYSDTLIYSNPYFFL